MPDIKTVGIISKPNVEAARKLTPDLLAWLEERGVGVRCDTHTAALSGSRRRD